MKRFLFYLLSAILVFLWIYIFLHNITLFINIVSIILFILLWLYILIKLFKLRNRIKINENNQNKENFDKEDLNNSKYEERPDKKKETIQIIANLLYQLGAKRYEELNNLHASDIDLNHVFNDYFEPALIKVPEKENENDRILRSLNKKVIVPDDVKPKSRLEYEALLKEAIPKHIYADAYISRKCHFYPKDYVVFDTETTGLEIYIDRIIEIGAIKYINHIPTEKFQMLINPGRDFDDYIVKLTGITKEELKFSLKIEQVLPLFYDFIEDYVLVAHNAPFDVKMMACEAHRSNMPMFNNLIIDTLTLAKRCISKSEIENYKLETIKNYLGLANKSHRALDDCETCSAIYQYYCTCNNK